MTIETHAQLYDLLHDYFGLGAYDDALYERRRQHDPWWKVRGVEIGKLKRLMTSRNVDIAAMVEAAEYGHRHHRPITAAWQVVELIPDARREARAAAERPLSERLVEATQQAVNAGETQWATRLATSSSVDSLDAWEAHRG